MKTADLVKEPTFAKGASLVSGVGALAMIIPFPYGFMAGSALQTVGGLMSMFGPKDKSDTEKAIEALGKSMDGIYDNSELISEQIVEIMNKL